MGKSMTGLGAKPVGSTWTDEQWQAIACRGSNTLVAAAAGSGKTAVLVERIIRRVCDEDHPLDVDRLLVATFTNAAAAEMRERIRTALENELAQNPSSRHLRSQLALLPRASITTLHSFCLEVIRRHYRAIGLDPGFRIANGTEAELIKQELMEQLVDSRFAAAEEGDGFWLLADGFGGEKGDGQLFRLIGTLYEASRSHPAPEAWLAEMAARFRCGREADGSARSAAAGRPDGGGNGADVWFASLAADIRLELSGIAGLLDQADRIAAQPAGPAPYRSGLAEEAAALRRLIGLAGGEWDELQQAAQLPVFGRLKPCRGDGYDKALVKAAQELRDAAKKRWAKMTAELFDRSRADYEAELLHMAPVMEALARLISDFAVLFRDAKRDKGLVDFSDLEHYALQILSAGTAEDGTPLPSEAALDYRDQFAEVLLDEYQDTNLVQETIVALVAQPGAGNRFLVGDVKQSIYRFRLAEPGLFLAKYKTYRADGDSGGACSGRTGGGAGGVSEIGGASSAGGAGSAGGVGEIGGAGSTGGAGSAGGSGETSSAGGAGSAGGSGEIGGISAISRIGGENGSGDVPGDETSGEGGGRGNSAFGAFGTGAGADADVHEWEHARRPTRADAAAGGLRIDLARNFRSRSEVVDGVNYLFRQIMEERVGEIRYDRSAELVAGASYPEVDTDLAVEAIILDKAGQTERAAAAGSGSAAGDARADHAVGDEGGSGNGSGSGAERGEAAETSGEAEGDALEETDALPDKGDPLSRQEQETARLEARLIAERIHRLMGQQGSVPFPVSGKGSNQPRPLAYRDIVILLRSTAGWAALFTEELGRADIPVYAELGTGFFSAVEVEVMLSLLQVIDNPYQDIPLAGVLHSPLVGLSADELAQLRVCNRSGSFYDAVLAYAGMVGSGGGSGTSGVSGRSGGSGRSGASEVSGGNEASGGSGRGEGDGIGVAVSGTRESGAPVNPELAEKAARFLQRLESWRRAARQTPVAELIWRLYRETRYYDYVGGLPGGIQRQANLRALHDRAKQYEETSFRGLFRFLRFLGRMRESGGDLGAARSLGEQEDVVKIMTIHKSKGLEFPVVFVAGLSKPFNRQDLNGSFLLHKDLGFGPKFIDLDLRVSYPSLASLAIRHRLRLEALAEEMRVLYVALTRAREKLILVGTVKDAAKAAAGWLRAAAGEGETLPDYELAAASCYLDWIGPALIRHPDAEELLRAAGTALARPGAADPSRWRISVLPAGRYAGAESGDEQASEAEMTWLDRLSRGSLPVLDAGLAAEVDRRLSWAYPHAAVSRLISKTTVSELKRLAERLPAAAESGEPEADGPRAVPVTAEASRFAGAGANAGGSAAAGGAARGGSASAAAAVFRRPRFAESRGLNAAERGTVYHAVMQRLELHPNLAAADIASTVQRMTARRLLTPEQAAAVDPAELFRFFATEVGRRLLFAAKVRRELPFSLKLPAAELSPGLRGQDAGEPVLVQGILDCLFEDAGGLVLLDYKTDALWQESASARAERYRLQLALYAQAVKEIFRREPDEIFVYFFDGAEAVNLGRLG